MKAPAPRRPFQATRHRQYATHSHRAFQSPRNIPHPYRQGRLPKVQEDRAWSRHRSCRRIRQERRRTHCATASYCGTERPP